MELSVSEQCKRLRELFPFLRARDEVSTPLYLILAGETRSNVGFALRIDRWSQGTPTWTLTTPSPTKGRSTSDTIWKGIQQNALTELSLALSTLVPPESVEREFLILFERLPFLWQSYTDCTRTDYWVSYMEYCNQLYRVSAKLPRSENDTSVVMRDDPAHILFELEVVLDRRKVDEDVILLTSGHGSSGMDTIIVFLLKRMQSFVDTDNPYEYDRNHVPDLGPDPYDARRGSDYNNNDDDDDDDDDDEYFYSDGGDDSVMEIDM